jgi:hypothetical protein
MRQFNYKSKATALSAAVVLGFASLGVTAYAAQATVDLQTASPFVILAGTPNITDVANASVITGNVGLSPASGAGIGLLCTQVSGTIFSVDAAGPLPCRITDGPLLVTAKNNLTAAYIDAAGRTPVTIVPTELGGTTKTAGVYASGATTFQITAGAGPLVLDGQGDASSVFIFEADAASPGLTIGPGSVVSLINGASACNVFWRVDTATINTTAVFKGTILALNSITVANGANIEGRLLARNGNVTLDHDTINISTCNTSSASASSGSGSVPKLPNTGFGAQSSSDNSQSVAVATITVVLATSAYLVRRKQTASIR